MRPDNFQDDRFSYDGVYTDTRKGKCVAWCVRGPLQGPEQTGGPRPEITVPSTKLEGDSPYCGNIVNSCTAGVFSDSEDSADMHIWRCETAHPDDRCTLAKESGGGNGSGGNNFPYILGRTMISSVGRNDDQPIIQEAINQAIQKGSHEVYLRAGTYNLRTAILFNPQRNEGAHLFFDGGNKIRLVGEESAQVILKFWNPNFGGITSRETKDLVLENLIIDWPEPSYGQGRVERIDNTNKLIWVDGDVGYPKWNHDDFKKPYRSLFLTRVERQNTPPKCDLYRNESGPVAGHRDGLNWYRYEDFSGCSTGLNKGDRVVFVNKRWFAHGIKLEKVRGALIQNIEMYHSPGTGIFIDHTDVGSSPDFEKILINRFVISYHPE